MAANTAPAFTDVPTLGTAICTAADTGYGGTGGTAPTTAKTLATGSANGTKIVELTVLPTGTCVQTVINVFTFDGATYWLYDQIGIAAVTLALNTMQPKQRLVYNNLILPSGSILAVTMTVANTAGLVVTALGSNF